MPFPFRPPTLNLLLRSMPEGDWRRMLEMGRSITCAQLKVLQRAEEPITAVYFPESGWVSLLVSMEGGQTAEVGMIGRESVVGLELLSGRRNSLFEWIVQGPGSLLRVDAADFKEALSASATFKASIVDCLAGLLDQVAQTAACNSRHTVDQRLARWLLMAHDRSLTDELPLTQELLAMMLGVRRAGVSVAASALKASGCIDCCRGMVMVKDRAALETVACECYQAVRHRCEQVHP